VEPQPSSPIEVFYSYAHEDEKLRDELEKHLANLRRQGVITAWYDRDISAGSEWDEEIKKRLDDASVILLLISPDFMHSEYCHNVEVKRAMERHDAGEACVIPVFLRPANWKGALFGKLQALPTDARAVTSWSNQDEAFVIVSEGIQRAVETLNAKRQATEATTAETRQTFAHIPRPPVVGFVTRRDEQGRDIVERLKEELTPQGNQLVTLSGPGGIGKTTLAAEAARALKEVFGGRIVWSSAEKRTDFALSTLLDDILTQLGREDLRTLAPDLKETQVRALVNGPPALVVLDNYETIAPDAEKRIEEWFALAQCSALFTSRHKINSTRNIPIAAMSRDEAQEYLEKLVAETQDAPIFSDKVRQHIYETAEANPYVMQWVVAQIDAAQEPNTVLEELAHGEGDAAQRVFYRSFNLPQLGDDGRAALLALSLFVPSATREALLQVAGFDDDSTRLNEAVKNLRALWLIKGLDVNRRFTIEGLTRSLARARISKDARAADFRQRFVAHFLSYTEAHAQPTPEDFDALELEKDNVLNAMDVVIDLKHWERVQRIASILAAPVTGMLSVHGFWDEAIKRNEQARDAAREMNQEHEIAIFSHRAGIIRQNRGEYDAARIANEEALAIYRRLNQEANEAVALHNLAAIAQAQGELTEARRLYDESLEINKKLGNQSGIASTLHNLAAIAQDRGELEEARRLYHESLEINKKLGDQSGIASTLHQLGNIAYSQGELTEAQRLYDESLEIAKKLGDQSGIAGALHNLAMIARAQGELTEARRLYDESLEINKKLGNQSGIADTFHQLGLFAELEGNREEAVRLMREALGIFEKLKSPNAEITRRVLKRLETETS
jgi:tetratricopeptide (TPR) repeat protein